VARIFRARAPDRHAAFPGVQGWLGSTGGRRYGDDLAGSFEHGPGALDGIILPVISGRYRIDGTKVTIAFDQDLPPGPVAARLRRSGLRVQRCW
jgi:hypothetical protein